MSQRSMRSMPSAPMKRSAAISPSTTGTAPVPYCMNRKAPVARSSHAVLASVVAKRSCTERRM
jgi:hypothetical protein